MLQDRLPVLRFENVSWSYARRGPELFSHFTTDLSGPGVVILNAPNMSGKSSLLRLAAGELLPAEGLVTLSSAPEFLQQDFATVMLPWKSVLWNLAAPSLADHPEALSFETAVAALEQLPLWLRVKDVLDVRLANLSGGMQHLCAIARALVAARPITLLDEPFTGLDRENASLVADSIQVFQSAEPYRLVVMATHTDLDSFPKAFIYGLPPHRPISDLINNRKESRNA